MFYLVLHVPKIKNIKKCAWLTVGADFSQPVYTIVASKIVLFQIPILFEPLAGGMKFAKQIFPLLNLSNFAALKFIVKSFANFCITVGI